MRKKKETGVREAGPVPESSKAKWRNTRKKRWMEASGYMYETT